MTKILVIEDEQFLREDIIEILRYESFEVVGADNGLTGIEMAYAHQPDLIICDIMMPELDGYGVLIELRSDPATAMVPFIFLTAKTGRAEMRRGMELGADDYLTKPFTQTELLAAINARLDKQKRITREVEVRLDELRQNVIHALPHELRTPLTGILGYARLMMEETETLDVAQIVQMAQGIDRAAQRIHRVTENYLLYAQIELLMTDGVRVEAIRTATTEDTKTLLGDVVLQKAYEYSRNKDLVSKVEDAKVFASAENLSKIVNEVLDNAFKFSSPGAPVEINAVCVDGWYTITITNLGRGMTPQQIARIGAYMQFERRFYEHHGLGMGLALTKRLVDLHNGQFDIQSIPNDKTTVLIKLRCVE